MTVGMTVDSLAAPSDLAQPTGSPPAAPRPVSAESLSAAKSLATRARNRSAQVRRSFLTREDDTQVTPLSLVLRGREDRSVGRGGEVRLKLLLSTLWVAGGAPYDVSYPARAWATLLDLRDPEGAGARRISQALQWLDERNFVDLEARVGRPPRVTLLRETGTGEPYEPPGIINNRLTQQLKNASGGREEERLRALRDSERYIQLAPSLWTAGWVQTLSAPGLSMLLVLMSESAGQSDRKLWLTPDIAQRRYGLSAATRSAGLRELVALRAVRVKRQTISRDVFDYRRMRNVYKIDSGVLADEPTRAPDRKLDPLDLF
jgi:hypothetical protein